MKKIITFIMLMLFLNIEVSAASLCSYQEQSVINSKAANIKTSYEAVEELVGTDEIGYYKQYFKISITNITEEFYVVMKNDLTNEEIIYRNSDTTDNILTINWDNTEKVTNFTIQIYTSNKTSCPEEKYKTMYITLPRYNKYSERDVCVENPDFYLCQRFVTFEEIDDSEFVNQIVEYKQKENKIEEEKPIIEEEPTIMDKVFEFIDTYKFFIIGGIVIAIGIIVIVHRVRTKKQRELGL